MGVINNSIHIQYTPVKYVKLSSTSGQREPLVSFAARMNRCPKRVRGGALLI